jgi:hypothetical protein
MAEISNGGEAPASTPQPTAPTNPLSKYFRAPGLQITIPTGGRFFPEGMYTPETDGSLTIYPMRAADELLLKNPDALMSGHAVESLLRSCVPGIGAPSLVSTPDLDVLMLAIRAATYGEGMSMEAVCPKCETSNEFDLHLPTVLNTAKPLTDDTTVRLSDDVLVEVCPYNLRASTRLSHAGFEESRRLQGVEMENPEMSSERRSAEMNKSMERITQLTNSLVSDSIISVVTPDDRVTDRAYISEFYNEAPSAWAKKIEKKVEELNEAGIEKTIKIECSKDSCRHQWSTGIEFDPSSFFGSGSSD